MLGKVALELWPWGLYEYPGRHKILAAIMGLSEGTIWRQIRKGGDERLSAGSALRLASWLRAKSVQLLAVAGELEMHAEGLKGRKPGRGFLTVKVRDESGIPRSAVPHPPRQSRWVKPE